MIGNPTVGYFRLKDSINLREPQHGWERPLPERHLAEALRQRGVAASRASSG